MKKFLILLCLISIPAVVFGKTLQQEDENIIRGVLNSSAGRISRHHAALKIDYISYQIQKGKTLYSQIIELENRYKDTPEDINLKYIKKLKDLYLFTASYSDEDSMSADFLRDFNSRRIVVSNEEYTLLNDELKVLLSVVNVFE